LLCQAKGNTAGSCLSKTMCSNLGEFGEEFSSNDSREELLVRIRVYAGPTHLKLASGGLLMSFSCFCNLASGVLLWNEEN